MVVLRLMLHKGTLHNKMVHIASFQLFAIEYN